MATIDSLEIQIQSSASNAAKEIDKLTSSLGRLAGSLNFEARGLDSLQRINGDNLKKIGDGINELSRGMRGFQNVGRINFEAISRDLGKLASVPAGNLERLGNAMRPLANGLSALSRTNFDEGKIRSLSDGLTRISRANIGNIDDVKLTQLGNSIKNFSNSLSGANKVEQSVISMTNAIAQLANAGSKIPTVTSSLDALGTKLKSFMNTMSSAPQVASETIAFSQAIGTLAGAGSKVKDTAGNLAHLGTQLKNFMQTMSTAPNVSDSVIRMTTALSGLVGQSGRVTISTNSLSTSFGRATGLSGRLRNSLRNLTGTMMGLGTAAGKTSAGFKSFLGQLKSAAGTYLSIYGAIRGLKSAIDISSDLTEVQNVVDVAFGDMAYKIEEFSKTSVTDFGMSELVAKQIAGRFQAMATAIGVSADKVGQANSFLSRQTDGYVAVSNSMADVSVNLTKLAADMASFYNVEQEDVAKSLESVFTGTTAPLRKYGLDLTQATLSEWALKQGLDADIKSMSQAEKTMLRYQYVLANTTAAQGDFARTADTWANSVRTLKQQLEILGSVVGGVLINAFKPFVNTLNKVMAKVISFAKTVADALGTIFGWTFEVNEGGITNDGFEDMSSGIEDVADSAGDAAKNVKDTTDEVKDLKANLQGFDKLNVISLDKDKDKNKTPSTGKGVGGGAGAGAGGVGGLDTNLVKADSILKKYESDIDSLYKLGEYIGNALTNAMNSIKWENIYAKAEGFGKGLADFLNGLISPELFSALGTTIANSLNTALHFLNSFGETFDWSDFGRSIAAGLTSFFDSFDWGLAGRTALTFGKGIADMLNNAITPDVFAGLGKTISSALNTALRFLDTFGVTFNWHNFGVSLGTGINEMLGNFNWNLALHSAKAWGLGLANAINAFISETDFSLVGSTLANALNTAIQFAFSLGTTLDFSAMGESISDAVNGFFATFDFSKLAGSINVWAKGLLDTLITFLDKTEWKVIGEKIGTFLAELDFLEIGAKVGKAIWEAINAGIETLKGMLSVAPVETALIAAFGAIKLTGIGSKLSGKIAGALTGGKIASTIKKALKTHLLEPISTFFADTLIPSITGLFSTLGSVFGLSGNAAVAAGGGIVVAGVIAAVAAIKDLWDTSELFRNSVVKTFNKIKASVSNAIKKVSDALKPLMDAFSDLKDSLSDFYQKGPIKPIVELFATLAVTIGGTVISAAIDVISDAFSALVDVLTGAIEVVSGVLDVINGIIHLDFDEAVEGFEKIASGVLDAFSGIMLGIFDIGVDIVGGLYDGIVDAISDIGSWLKKNVFDPFIKGFKKAFGIASPSKVMKEQGNFIIQGLISGIKSMISNVAKAISDLKDKIIKKFNDIKKKFTEKGKEIIEGIKTGITNKWNDFATFWGKKKDAVIDKFKDVKDKFLAKGKEIINGIKSGISEKWNEFSTYWQEKKDAIVNKFNDIKEKFLTKGGHIISGIKSGISSKWSEFATYWQGKKDAIIDKFNDIKDKFITKGKNIISGIKSGISSKWSEFATYWQGKKDAILKKFEDIKSKFETKGKNIISGIKSGISGKWSEFIGYWVEKRDGIVKKFDSIKDTFKSKGAQIVSGLKEGISSKWSEFKSFFEEKIKGVVNGIIHGINWVLGKVGSKKTLGDWKGFAKGSGGIPEDTIGVVNDQKGPTYRELIVPPHGKPFIPKGRNIMLPLEKGTKIMPALETKRFMSGLPHFEGGIGDFLGSAWEKVKNFTGQVWDYITEPKKIIQIAIDKFTNLSGILEPMLSIAKGAVSTIADGALGFIKKIFDTEAKVDYKPGAGVEQWRGLATKALQITGQYTPANLSRMLMQMQTESGGNPNAINNWDINAKNGTPSKGLMQVIQPTFDAYALPPYNKNIYDPLSNMIAAIRYTMATYKSLTAGWQGHGYSQGIGRITLSDVIPGYASGGFPASGQLFMARENGISELVGRIGSNAAVANNQQIVKSVSRGVSDAVKKVFEPLSEKIVNATESSFESIEKTTEALTRELRNTNDTSIGQRTNNLLEKLIEESGETEITLELGLGKSFERNEKNERGSEDIAEKLLGGIEKDLGATESEEKTFIPTSGLDQYVADMQEWIESMRQKAISGFSGIADEAWTYGEDAAYAYSGGMYDNSDEVDDAVDGMAGDIADGFSDTEYEVQISGGNIVSGLTSGMSKKWNELMEWANSARKKLLETFSSMGDGMYRTGADIISKFLDGINSLWEKVSESAEKIKTAFQSAQIAESQIAQIHAEVNTMEISEKAKDKAERAGNYRLADFSSSGNFSSFESNENNFTRASRNSNVDSVSGELVTGISAGVADAINKLLIPAFENERNVNVTLEGDAGRLFKVMQDQDEKYKTITGRHAFS